MIAPTIPKRGILRVYLGAAPGVGKTVAMLGEGHRRQGRGVDVVIGIVETHGREHTQKEIDGLPVIPRLAVSHRGITLQEMDLDAVLQRKPQVVLVDEMAHTNAPGSLHEKRWQDIETLITSGINVITTVNVQHLESLTDAVQAITGIRQTETVPDAVVRAADQIELVDMSPQALRRRLAHGHVYPAERVDAAMGNYFREGNLGALRELALLWVADRVEEALERYRAQHGISGTWPSRERIVVALSPGPEGEQLLRRGARITGRVQGRDLTAVLVVPADGTVGTPTHEVERLRTLTESLGGSFHLVVGDDPASAALEFARSVNGTQIVVGASKHSRLVQVFRSSTSMSIVQDSGDIDVHMVTHPRSRTVKRRRISRSRRTLLSWALAPVIPVALTLLMLPLDGQLDLSAILLIYLLGVLGNALVGGILQAVFTSLAAGLMANYFFIPPTGSLTINGTTNVLALVVSVVVGTTVASVVDRSSRRAREAERGRSESQLFAAIAGGGHRGGLMEVLERARVGFGMNAVSLLQSLPGGAWEVLESVGENPPQDPDQADAFAQVDPDPATASTERALAMSGRRLSPADLRVVEVVAAQALAVVERRQLETQAAQTQALLRTDTLRTALLAALSHDLRTPLATVKAALSSLSDQGIELPDQDRQSLLLTAEGATDELAGLLENLLDMSRLQTGALRPIRRPVSVDEVLHRALISVPPGRLVDEIPDDLPLLDSDSGLLERVFANIVGNAVRHSPDSSPIRITAGVVPGAALPVVQVRVCDQGPGVAGADKERMYVPFQQLGDAPDGNGIGLGLAVARGLADAVDAQVDAEDTPGGGLTMVVTIPLAARPAPNGESS